MAEEIALSVVKDVVKQLLRYAADEVGLALSFKSELEKLEERSEMVDTFLSDAESRPSSDLPVQLWLKKLKVAVTKADAVLDEFHYELLRRKLEVRGRFTKKVTDFFFSSNNPLAFRLRLAHNIKDINSRLDAINNEATVLGLVEKVNTSASQPLPTLPPTHPGFDEKSVVGREVDESVIVDKLLELSDTEELPVISIWGMGGQGKTTLAKLVCKNNRVVGRFDEQIWVCVSTNFDVTRLLNEMLESLIGSNSNMSNMGGLIRLLNEKLTGRRYLLILDDVWNESRVEWKSVRDALLGIGGANGSTIIVTCRANDVALVVDPSYTHHLSFLSTEDSWTLFRNRAFAYGGASETPNLVKIGKEIVRRCGGVPLAIDMLGSLMHSEKSEGEWGRVVDSLDEELTDVNTILKVSYDHLSSSSLKSCFAVMSIFPKNSNLEKSFFVRLWTALGLLPPPDNSNFVLEDFGDKYFDLLVRKSLLQDVRTDVFENIEGCRMHDLVHDLALRVSKGYCFTMIGQNEVSDIPKGVVHLNFRSSGIEALRLANGCFQTLQTLILTGSLPENVVSKLKLLRVLALEHESVKELPPSIGNLKHLRVLDVSRTSITQLPSSFTKLYHLQTLNVQHLDNIPKRFGDLVNLRHFCFSSRVILIGVRKMTLLQTLPRFVVCREMGCLVGELGRLSNLKGKLEIHGLDDVRDEEEAKSAMLVGKPRIEALEFWWDGNMMEEEGGESNRMEVVLEGLRPHWNLKSLSISNFKGFKFPSWMISASDSAIKNLVEIKLVGCDRCKQVPALGHLPNLKKVLMKGLKKVEKIGQEFYYGNEDGLDNQNMLEQEDEYFGALRELVLEDMEMLEEWEDVKQLPYVHPSSSSSSSSVPRRIIHFRNLEKLKIEGCGNLVGVPSGRFPSLKKLELEGVNPRMEVQRMSSWGLTCLTFLRLSNVCCEGLERVIEEWFKNNTTSLAEVRIADCNTLVELQPRSSLFSDCVALKTLKIKLCPNLEVIPDVGGGRGEGMGLAQSLRELSIHRCRKLKRLPRGIETLTSLQHLNIPGGDDQDIPRMPSSLRVLILGGTWGNIQQLPQQQLGHLFALESLSLSHMKGLEALPEWLQNFNNLKTLWISNCKNLKEMPTLDAIRHLKYLHIWDCPEILKERCVKGSGTDWPRIQHIPFIQIDGEVIQDIKSS